MLQLYSSPAEAPAGEGGEEQGEPHPGEAQEEWLMWGALAIYLRSLNLWGLNLRSLNLGSCNLGSCSQWSVNMRSFKGDGGALS